MPNTEVCTCSTGACACYCDQCVQTQLERATLAASPHRTCTRCSRSLPEGAFGQRASGTYQSWCRECSAEHARLRRQGGTQPEAVRTAGRARRASNPFDRPFGLEVEVVHPDALGVRDALRTAGLECENEEYNHTARTYWKIVPDGSIYNGFELVSPVLRGADGRRQARLAFQALREAGATVDRNCGLHVHLEATDLTAGTIARIVSLWHDEQTVIDGLVAPSRRSVAHHSYCGPVDRDSVNRARDLASQIGERTMTQNEARSLGYERYQTLNLCSYAIHGTLEVRQHQGTLNATKALAWVQFCQALFARAIANPAATPAIGINSLLTACESAGLDSTIASYLMDRHEGFAGNRIAA